MTAAEEPMPTGRSSWEEGTQPASFETPPTTPDCGPSVPGPSRPRGEG